MVNINHSPALRRTCDNQKRQNVIQTLNTPIVESHHPMVQSHNEIWYKNWLTCDICGTWATTLQTLVKDEHYVKSFKGLSWFACSTQYSQTFCKYFVGEIVDAVLDNAFTLLLNKNMMCGYYFDLCRTNFYKTLKTSDYYDTVYEKNKESDDLKAQNANNNFLDELYAKQK